jgi:uncharacterized membrane protein
VPLGVIIIIVIIVVVCVVKKRKQRDLQNGGAKPKPDKAMKVKEEKESKKDIEKN